MHVCHHQSGSSPVEGVKLGMRPFGSAKERDRARFRFTIQTSVEDEETSPPVKEAGKGKRRGNSKCFMKDNLTQLRISHPDGKESGFRNLIQIAYVCRDHTSRMSGVCAAG